MSHMVERMFSVREIPWHFNETQDRTLITPDRLTLEEAIPWSGLDWSVRREPIYVESHNWGADAVTQHMVPVDNMIAIRRNTDDAVLGIHTEGYQENQPRELFEWGWGIIEASVEEGMNQAAVWETGGSLAGGKKIFAMIRLPEDVVVDGDKHIPYLGLADSFDGSMARRAWLSFVRVVCWNTLDWSWSSAINRIAIRHTKNSDMRIAAAREALGMTYRNVGVFADEVETMMNQAVMDDRFFRIVDGLFPEPQKKETETQRRNRMRRRNTVHRIYYDSSTVAPYRGTAWGVLNAVQEWEQWSARAGSSKLTSRQVAERQMRRIVTGTWPVTNKAAKELVLARR